MRRQIEQAGNDILSAGNQQLSFMQKMANQTLPLVITFIITMTIAAIVFSLVEDKDLTNSYWWATVTSTTVGYGDLYPTKLISKLVAGLFMFFCVYYIQPLITAKMSAQLIVNSDAFTHAEQEQLKEQSRRQVELLEAIMLRLDALENKS